MVLVCDRCNSRIGVRNVYIQMDGYMGVQYRDLCNNCYQKLLEEWFEYKR